MSAVDERSQSLTGSGYRPEQPIEVGPPFQWPMRLGALGKWLFGFPGYLWPWSTLFMALALLSWRYLTPPLTQMKSFSAGWIVPLLVANLTILVLFAGLWHWRLYVQKAQGTDYKFNRRWLSTDSPTFLFRSQLWDNVFWSLGSAVPIWTAYEAATFWLQANGWTPTIRWQDHPVYCMSLVLLTPIWLSAHFYAIHRLIHWPPLYRSVHYLHHKNVNFGPWSGLAMHPVEHLLFFSPVILFWFIPSHPLHSAYLLMFFALSPALGHSGFERVVFKTRQGISLDIGDYMHYLHHKYFNVNFGSGLVLPLDKWLGTFHDGSDEATQIMKKRMRSRRSTLTLLVSALIVAVALPTAPRAAEARSVAAERCEALSTADFSNIRDAPTQIIAAKMVEAKASLPAHCAVKGYVVPQAGFELQLPASDWNGKFLHVGCGLFCGSINAEDCTFAVRRGYACLLSDMGHTSTAADAKWAYNNLQAEVDYAYRATHVVTLAGKAIAKSYYGTDPQHAYFMGCSQGGRQGLVEAQRFPWDFDGIVAGAPVVPYALQGLHLFWVMKLTSDPDHAPLFSERALRQLHDAVMRRCDREDGLIDGILADPRACGFDPDELACSAGKSTDCLTPRQVGVVKKLYAGLATSNGQPLYAGLSRGSELDWIGLLISTNREPPLVQGFTFEKMKYLSFMPDPGPAWQPADVDIDRDARRVGLMDSLYGGRDPDLRRFEAAGGKLLMYQGWNDPLVPPGNAIDYYETVERLMGGRAATQDFARLFVLPGVSHCGGGEGADTVDYLTHLERWAEQGQAPEHITAARLKDAASSGLQQSFPLDEKNVAFTRTIYPYPHERR